MRKVAVLSGMFLLACASLGELRATSPNSSAVQKVVDARVAHYKEIGKSAKAIRDELGQSQPSLSKVESDAARIEMLAKEIPSWFPAGTGQQAGVKSEALPRIWQQMPLFRERASGLAGAAHQISAAAAGGNLATTTAAAANLGIACKACHDTFREKK